ncbi:hypothetical protein KW798_01235 [Candidatus Parcubacteria bacterium]|nr:hypothetical protein [Candidatus Parcubacteria bacterium]
MKSIFLLLVIVQTILHYLGWIAIILGVIALVFGNFSRAQELVLSGIGFIILKYILGALFLFLSKQIEE